MLKLHHFQGAFCWKSQICDVPRHDRLFLFLAWRGQRFCEQSFVKAATVIMCLSGWQHALKQKGCQLPIVGVKT